MKYTALLMLTLLTPVPAFSGGVSFVCDANIDNTQPGTCADLNSIIANIYNSTFSDATASIYIQFGSTSLGESAQFYNTVSYFQYYQALAQNAGDANDVTAVSSLASGFNPVVSGDGVALTSALDLALGLGGATGINTSDGSCAIGTTGCYNGIVTISDTASLFYRSGSQDPASYDFYTVVEHETDEILGTSSCLTMVGPGMPGVSAGCSSAEAPADLFRYANPGVRSYVTAANGTTAYFSIDGGSFDIANYNNAPNGDDYGDWDSAVQRVQNAVGGPGSGYVDITNDGGSEISVLDAAGYNLVAPEPGTIGLFAAGISMLALRRRREEK